MKEKQSIKQKANDFFYETHRKIFYPNGRKVGNNVNAKRHKLVFIWVVLALPILQWLVFWLYVICRQYYSHFNIKERVHLLLIIL